MLSVLLILAGFALLIKGADWLVDGAAAMARRLNVSELAIGLTIVAFGTSAPELAVNVSASLRGSAGIAVGNVLGSNIANILLILGLTALMRPLAVTRGTVWKEIPFSLLAAVALALMAGDRWIDGAAQAVLSRSEAGVLLLFFAIFLYYSAGIAQDINGLAGVLAGSAISWRRSLLLFAGGLAGLILGGHWLVTGAVRLALQLGVDENLVGLTIVAVGTSLPELATSLAAARKGSMDIAVGNIVGSNIFNIFFILGLSALIRPLPLATASTLDLAVVILASLLLFGFMFTGSRHKLDRWEGGLLLALYLAYLLWLVLHGSR